MSTELSAAVFQHDPLPDEEGIRLVTVLPDLLDGNIACRLSPFDGSSTPEYTALSYLWGDPTPKHIIYINGRVRRIHENLWRFLCQMWQDKDNEYFWIDSICLDQDNHSERNEQVQRMGEIYSQAHHVLSWLGDTSCAIKVLRCIRDDQVVTEQDYVYFFNLEYWSRVWIIQEVVCAKICYVVCGSVQIPFNYLFQTTRLSTRLLCHLIPLGVWALNGFRKSSDWEFMDLIRCSRDYTSTREVDRVYGLLGLAKRFDPNFDWQALEVDYEKSLNDVILDIACLNATSLDTEPLLELLENMPKLKDSDTIQGKMLSIEADLERYSISTKTSERCRTSARVALDAYRIMSSTIRYVMRRYLFRSPWKWKQVLIAAFEDYSWVVQCAIGIQRYGKRGSRPSFETDFLSQSGDIRLGLYLVYRIICDSCEQEDSHDPPLDFPRWYCEAHMPENNQAEPILSMPILTGHCNIEEFGLSCAVATEACRYTTLSHEIEGEGHILEIEFPDGFYGTIANGMLTGLPHEIEGEGLIPEREDSSDESSVNDMSYNLLLRG